MEEHIKNMLAIGIPQIMAEEIYKSSLKDVKILKIEHMLDYSIKCRIELFQHTQKMIQERNKIRKNPKQELNKLFLRA